MQKTIQQFPLFWLRNVLILGQLLIWVLHQFVWTIDYPQSVIIFIVVHFMINLLFGFKKAKNNAINVFLHLLMDVLLLSIFFYLTGGATNPFIWFLLIPIIFSTTLLKQKYTWYLTFVSITCYSLLINYNQPLNETMAIHDWHDSTFNEHLIGMWVGFIVISLLIAFALVSFIEKLREKDQLLAKIELKQAENAKMLALATLATGSAHELGTPLATMNIIVNELVESGDLIEHREALSIIASQIKRCKASLAKITASTGTTQAIDGVVLTIDDFINHIKKNLSIPSNIQLDIHKNFKEDDRILVETTLVQSMVNLVNNAMESQADRVEVDFVSNHKKLKIFITDNGSGMPDKMLSGNHSEKEFGMGLGMFLAQATIERFNGNVNINVEHKKGTQLMVDLPLEFS